MPTLAERYEVRYAPIDTAAAGDQTVVAAITGRSIVVLAYTLVVTNATSLPRWKSGSTNLSGAMAIATNGSVSADNEAGVLKTAAGQALVLNNATATQLSGHVTYVVS